MSSPTDDFIEPEDREEGDPPTADDVLIRAIELLRDPERVVKDPLNLFEEADGTQTWLLEEACRGCLLGVFDIAAHELGADPYVLGQAQSYAWHVGGNAGPTEALRYLGAEECAFQLAGMVDR